MHQRDGHLQLSPSDVTAFLACEHLTTLSLAQRAGRSSGPRSQNEQRELIFRKGLEHERAYLESLRAEGKSIAEIEFDELDWEAAQARDGRGDARAAVDVVYQGVFVERRAGAASPTSSSASRTAPTRRSTRSSPAARSPPTSSSSSSTTSSSRGSRGASRSRSTSCSARASRPAFTPARVRRLLPARARAARALRRRPAGDRAVPGRPLRHLRLQAALRRALGRASTTSSRVAGVYRTQIEKLAAAGITTLAAARARAGRARACRHQRRTRWAKNREQAELQLWAREHGEDRFVLLQPQPEAGFALLPDPSPGDLFFDFEGNPFWDKDGSLEYLWGILDVDRTFTPLHAHDHATERQAFETFVDLVHARLAELPGPARLPLRAVRDHRAPAADGPLRHARGRARRPAPPRRLRRPAQGRPQRHPRLAPGLRAEGAGGLPRLPPRGGDPGRRHVDRRLRAVDADAATRRSSTRSTPTTARTASRRCSCATGCSSGARRRSRSSGRSRCPSRRSRSRSGRRRPSGRHCVRGCSTRARSSRRSCSTTTTASASPSGGRSSTGSR